MTSHNFSFKGGDILTGMGASWFVSYLYYKLIDSSHKNWEKVSAIQPRISKFNKGQQYYKFWLERILEMNPKNLNKNKLELNAIEIKNMAKELLNII